MVQYKEKYKARRSPRVFITHLERVLDKVNKETQSISVHGVRFMNLKFADDIEMIEEDEEMLEGIVNEQ